MLLKAEKENTWGWLAGLVDTLLCMQGWEMMSGLLGQCVYACYVLSPTRYVNVHVCYGHCNIWQGEVSEVVDLLMSRESFQLASISSNVLLWLSYPFALVVVQHKWCGSRTSKSLVDWLTEAFIRNIDKEHNF